MEVELLQRYRYVFKRKVVASEEVIKLKMEIGAIRIILVIYFLCNNAFL